MSRTSLRSVPPSHHDAFSGSHSALCLEAFVRRKVPSAKWFQGWKLDGIKALNYSFTYVNISQTHHKDGRSLSLNPGTTNMHWWVVISVVMLGRHRAAAQHKDNRLLKTFGGESNVGMKKSKVVRSIPGKREDTWKNRQKRDCRWK